MSLSWLAIWWENWLLRWYRFFNEDHDGNPLNLKSIEYNDDVAKKDGKLEWKEKKPEKATLRKYPIEEVNGYIYIWVHALK